MIVVQDNLIFFNASAIKDSFFSSKLAVASSRMRREGLFKMALAKQTLCF